MFNFKNCKKETKTQGRKFGEVLINKIDSKISSRKNNEINLFRKNVLDTKIIQKNIIDTIGDNLNVAIEMLYEVGDSPTDRIFNITKAMDKKINSYESGINWTAVNETYLSRVKRKTIIACIGRLKNEIVYNTESEIAKANDELQFAFQILEDTKNKLEDTSDELSAIITSKSIDFDDIVQSLHAIKDNIDLELCNCADSLQAKKVRMVLIAKMYKLKIKYSVSLRYISKHYSSIIKESLKINPASILKEVAANTTIISK